MLLAFPGASRACGASCAGTWRVSLVLAACRCAGDPAWEERVERKDVEAAVALLAYFKAHARRVHAEAAVPNPLDLLAAELWELLAESGGRWEGSATELHQVLVERAATAMPERPDELSKLVLRIGERSPVLDVTRRWRKLGGRDGKSSRILRLVAQSPENAVDPVVTVVTDPDRDNGDYGDNAVCAQRRPATAERDYSDNTNNTSLDDESRESATRHNGTDGDSSESAVNSFQAGEPTVDDTGNAKPDHPTDGRTRFTL